MPGRVLLARAGVIVGPHENIGRLPWWLRRLAEGGETLAPGPPEAELQLIDARDLAAWMLDMAEAGGTGAYNAIVAAGLGDVGRAARAAREVTGGGAELRWVAPELIEARVEEPWEALPLWPIPSLPGLYGMSAQRAARAGLDAAAAGARPSPTPGHGSPPAASSTTGGRSCARAGSRPRPSATLLRN